MKLNRQIVSTFIVLWLAVLLAGCQVSTTGEPSATVPDEANQDRIVTDLTLDLPELSATGTDVTATIVTTDNRRANIRSGPGTEFSAVAAADSGTEFDVVAKNDASDWFQICCIPGEDDAAGEATALAWVSDIVLQLNGEEADIPTFGALYPEELESTWTVDWTCGSERCELQECGASVSATAEDVINQQWLQMKHAVTWDETCFSTDEWSFEVDRFSGEERTTVDQDNFLYRYWTGPQIEEANAKFLLDDGREIAAHCSGPHQIEVEEGDGWFTVYEGNTCHDVRTGMLLSLSYTKEWLFTGEFEGESYEREYFGDFETLNQVLVDTNADLYFLDED